MTPVPEQDIGAALAGQAPSADTRQETSTPASPAPPARRQDLELLRIASAFGIVLFHSGSDVTGIGYSGLVVFLVLSTMFSASRPPVGHSIRQILLKRASRILVPWTFWMVTYGIRNHFVGRNILEIDRGWFNGILAGTQIHLWFLPYIFFASVALDLLTPRIRRRDLSWFAGIAATAMLATSPWWRAWAADFGYPTVQYAHGLAGLLAGVFLAGFSELDRSSRWYLFCGILGTAGVATWDGIDGVGIPYLVGFGLVALLALFHWKRTDRWNVRPVSDCMFGVYLVHIIFDRMYSRILGIPDDLEPVLTFASSFALVWLLRRFARPVARWIT